LVALSREVDLLVCGSRRHGPLRRLVLGSTSDYLAHHVDVPLIITAPADASAIERWRELGQVTGVSVEP
jgi:nucleotide-binding universal stress UspA family protein